MDGTDHEYWLQGCEDEREEERRRNRPVPPITSLDIIGFILFLGAIIWAGVWLVERIFPQ